jgi:CDGSH-type Zn-finger protein
MSSDKKPGIKAVSDGPYIVNNLKSFANQKGSIKTDETIALCRCGQSSNKPYCDGTHTKTGFKSINHKQGLENKRDSYAGKQITIHDNRSICAHAGYCTDSLSSVFRMKQEPWIDPDAATNEEIIAAIQKCPSGALSYTIDNAEHHNQNNDAGIFIAPNGPYVVTGCPDLHDTAWAEGATKQQFTLCRCGASNNKPFCDGSHWSIEFRDDNN